MPILTRSDVSRVPALTRNGAPLYWTTTSGTSGIRVMVASNAEERLFRRLLMYRPFAYYDLPDEVRQLIFIDVDSDTPVAISRSVNSGGRRFLRWVVGARASPSRHLAAIRLVRPHLITGITSAIARLAEAADGKLRTGDLRVVSPAGEYLTLVDRQVIQDAFGVEVYDRYGATEVGAIAWECPFCRRYHANVDELVIEPRRSGVAITPLFLTTQPLLRYRMDDIVSWDGATTSCQIQLQPLLIEAARRDDWIYDGTETKVSSQAFRFEAFDALRRWRLHQLPDGTMLVYVSWFGAASTKTRLEIAAEVQAVVPGRPVRVIDGAEHAPHAGKFKRVTSAYVPRASAESH